MRVLIVSTYPKEGCGLSNYTEELFLASDLEDVDATTISVDSGLGLLPWLRTLHFVLDERIGLVNVQYGTENLGLLGPLFVLLLSKLTPARTVLTSHEKYDAKREYVSQTLGNRKIVAGVLSGLILLYEYVLYLGSDVTVVHTEEHAAELRTLYGIDPVVIPHFVSDSASGTDSHTIGNLSEDDVLKIDERDVIGTFGRVTPKKGHGQVLEGLEALEDVVYVIAGPELSTHSEYAQELRRTAWRNGLGDRVYFTGFVPETEVPNLFELLDVAVFPYETVTQSGALFTALSHHCPIAARNLPAFREELQGVDGACLFSNSHQMQECIYSLLECDVSGDDPPRDLETRSVEAVREKYVRVFFGDS